MCDEDKTQGRDEIEQLRRRVASLEAAETEGRQAEVELARSQAFIRCLVEVAPFGILFLDSSGTITYENPAMARMMGVPPGMPSPVIGHDLAELPSIHQPELLPMLRRCLAGETIVGQLAHYTSLMGQDLDLEVHAAPLLNDEGQWSGAIVMAYDVTRHLQAEAESRRLVQKTQQQLKELTLLFETNAAISASLDIDTVLHTTAERIARAFGVGRCTISVFDTEQNAMVTLLDYAMLPDETHTVPAGTCYSLERYPASRQVLAECCSLAFRSSDPGTNPMTLAWMQTQNVKALLMVPLVVRGKAIGCLELLELKEERIFTPDEIRLCETLANQAAAVIDSARLHAETQRRLREQIVLREAGAAISSALNLETVLQRIAEHMGRAIGSASAYICSYDPATSCSIVVAEYKSADAHPWQQASNLGAIYPEKDPIFLEAMEAGRHYVFDLADPHLADSDRQRMAAYGAKTILNIPLLVKGRLIGYLELWAGRQLRTFTADEIAFCQDLAWQAAIALENAHLYERAQQEIADRRRAEEELYRRNQEMSVLNRVIAASAASHTAETILEITCRELALAFDVPQSIAALLNDARTEAVVVAEYLAPGRPPLLGATIPVVDDPSYQYLLTYKAPLVIDDAQNDPRLAPLYDQLRRRGTISLLLVPLLVEGHLAGSLGLGAIEPRPFLPEEVILAQRVAEQVSGSLSRVWLEQDHLQLEEKLQQMQKMEALGQMAGGITHDFNNLLTVIGTATHLLEKQLHPRDPAREPVDRIREAADRAAGLIRQLLSFSRRQVVEPRILDLNHCVSDLQAMLQRILGETTELVLVLKEGLWPIKADPSQIDQVLVNLVMNARAAMPRGGIVAIETSNVFLDAAYVASHMEGRVGEHVLLAVRDSGEGMNGEVQAHLFEPFFTTREQGTGLGLSTIYGIVKQNDGQIEVTSAVGKGTTFRIYLPRAEGESPLPAEPRPAIAAPQRGEGTILLVEDEGQVRELAARILKSYGYHVLTAEHGPAALQISAECSEAIDLLLTDVVMPLMNGQELADRLRQRWPAMQVLYISGYADDVIAELGTLAPGAFFLPKPFTLESLMDKVWHILEPPGYRETRA